MDATRHALRLQTILAMMIVTGVFGSTIVDYLSTSLTIELRNWFLVAIELFTLVLFSMFVGWSTMWVVWGPGKWWGRMWITWMVSHLALALALLLINTFFYATSSYLMVWREVLAVAAGVSYALAAQTLAFIFLVWLMKWMRWRLVYVIEPHLYPHPRTAEAAIRHGTNPVGTLLSNRLSLFDLLALTAAIAIYLAAWKPIVAALPDDTFLGPGFLFFLILGFFTADAVITFVVLIMGFIAMYDRWGIGAQWIAHSLLMVLAILISVTAVGYWGTADAAQPAITGLIVLAAFQSLLYWLLKSPAQRFRFRLTRLCKP